MSCPLIISSIISGNANEIEMFFKPFAEKICQELVES